MDVFYPIVMPSGPSCASIVTYAAGLSEKVPRNTAFIDPVDPTGNAWFPPEMMSIAIPFEMATASERFTRGDEPVRSS